MLSLRMSNEGRTTSYRTLLRGSGRGCPLLRASNEHILYRARSASKKAPGRSPHPSEAARCASTGIVPATPHPFSASCSSKNQVFLACTDT